MAEKPIPEYMKGYMENIGHESFADYQMLSNEYHTTKQVYHELKHPRIIPATGRFSIQKHDVQADLYRIEEQFKSRALETACKYGYNDPGYENYDQELTEKQEGAFGNLSKDDFDRSPEDRRAQKAHAVFEKEHPDKIADRQSNREIIDHYHSGPDRPEPKQQSPAMEAPEKAKAKEPLSREELLASYASNRGDMMIPKHKTSMSARFSMTLSAEREMPKGLHDLGMRDVSKGKEDIEMDRDR